MSDLHRAAVAGYGNGARVYERGRPGFPPGALDWLRNDLGLKPGETVLELGAGTGKFTRVLTQTEADVIAIEPVAAMLAQLIAVQPNVRVLRANAQALPVATASVDAVLCAQSFHWFATRAALAEIHRVLKPGGMLGLIWNVRDRSVAWVDELAKIVDRYENDAPRYDNCEWRSAFPAPGFSPLHDKSIAQVHIGSAERVIVERTASISFIAALQAADRRVVLDQVRAMVSTTPELAGKPEVGMPYITRMYWCRAITR